MMMGLAIEASPKVARCCDEIGGIMAGKCCCGWHIMMVVINTNLMAT